MEEEFGVSLLVKYLAGDCSPDEKERVEHWISQKPGAAERMARLQRVWEQTEEGGSPSSEWNAGAAWEEIQSRIEEDTAAQSFSKEGSEYKTARSQDRRSRRGANWLRPKSFSRIAGAVVAMALLALLTTLAVDAGYFSFAQTEEKVYTAQRGQQSTVHLTDGTKVRLNVDSRLTIPTDFDEDEREVRLEGEAYFEVERDTTRPFTVHARDATIRVLGTTFNVDSYSGAKKTRVAVSEGKVAVEPNRDRVSGKSAILIPQSLALVSEEGTHVREDVKLSKEIAWTNERLVFENAPFEEVVRKLERWYDIRAKVTLPAGNIVSLNATFKDAPLERALRGITAALNVKYDRDGRTVTFYR